MKKLLLCVAILSSFTTFGGPLADAVKLRSDNKEVRLPSPINFSTEELGELVAQIYNCAEEDKIPCTEVEGDKNYQIGIVTTYAGRLEKGTDEHTLATILFLQLSKNRRSLDTMNSGAAATICKKYPAGLIKGCP
ncbi:hypothetical protein M899_1658 [Bacteriovorax sp. BSW11_IV]|uniref:hypothetical protein n=1 Tax=Bacteriovorax sp. BSW11_IV TaxID=1353529 RepID=UPI00038A2DFC|nr:hypothetical protein [Bacteriovorax sp. BSW11_IV]EQC49461.1 hypothetical protein M899_1658 [Bacteriovorax sp. BSW11_IV]